MLYFNIFSQNLIPGLKRMGGEIAMITREKVFKETEQREIDLFHVKVCFLYCLVIHCHQLLVQMMNRVYFYFFYWKLAIRSTWWNMCTIIFNFTAGNYKQSLVHKGKNILQNTKKQESHAIISTLLPIENLCFYTTRTTYKFMLLYHQDNI